MAIDALFSTPVYFSPNVVALTVSTTVVSIDPSSIPAGASGAIVSNAVGAGPVNWAYGVDPSTTLGIPLAAGEAMVFEDARGENGQFPTLRFIRQGGSDGTLTFQFLVARDIR